MAKNTRKSVKRQKKRLHERPRSPHDGDSHAVDLGPLPHLIGYAIRQTQIAVFRDFQRSFADYDIRPIQYGVLAVIETNPGLKQSQVCAALGIKRANFVPLLNDLESRKLAERRSTEDRRANALFLTAKGSLLMRKLRYINRAHERRVATKLNDKERALLIDLLNRTRQAAIIDC